MSEDTVNIEVNGVAMQAPKGAMIISVTDAHDVYIPRFCYHEKLPVAANCRMCLVEVEKAPKPLPACATPVAEGMKVFTKSPKAIAAQKAVMEFLLINHPLDCPICDQGGECELQDLAVGFGRGDSRYVERKRVVRDQSLGALVATDMTRCIHCTRCVRFGQDVAGIQELGTIGRGENTLISTYIERSVEHELSGNIIDLCPVGALTSKPFRFHGRGWEMTQVPLISPHDGLGANLYGHVLRGELKRVVPCPNEAVNETWIADRDRFSYEGVYAPDRLQAPLVRASDGSWREADWETALGAAAKGLAKVREHAGAAGIGLLAHPSSTLEELHLLARIADGLGTANIDHRLRRRDFRDQAADALVPSLGLAIADVERLEGLLVVGSNLRRELPLLAHRVRKAARRGARVGFVNPAAFPVLFPVAGTLAGADLAGALAGVLAAALDGAAAPAGVAALLRGAKVGDTERALAAALKAGQRKAIWLGALALRAGNYAELRQLAQALAAATGATLGELAEGGNAAGAHLAGVLPHRGAGGAARAQAGKDARQMLEQPLAGYLLHGLEPAADSGLKADLAAAKYVVAVTPYASEELKKVAHVLLPAGTFAETSGTYVNLEGRWQSQSGAARPVGQARPGWKILRVLANQLGLAGFEYQSSEDVRDELRAALGGVSAKAGAPAALGAPAAAGEVQDVPMYQVDAVLRRAAALQRTREGQATTAVYGGGGR
ncbi:MAG: NADH-quinone oxidoreductase subunit NuoG [Steroidobacteraceae bacterium]